MQTLTYQVRSLQVCSTWEEPGTLATSMPRPREITALSSSTNAKNVYFVASAADTANVSVTVDGKPFSGIAGPDVTGGVATISDERLYQLVAGTDYGVHTLE